MIKIKKNWRSWKWWRGRYCARILRYLFQNKGIYIVDEDWDNLIILDACRYDIFRKTNTIEGKLESRISRGSCTKGFLLENFKKHPRYSSFRDIVYVTANPFVNLLLSDCFYRIYSVWDYGWDDDLNTVPPVAVVKETLKAYQENPDKRMIIHFLQPHHPFLGAEFAQGTGFRRLRNTVLKNTELSRDIGPWDLVEKGKLNVEEVRLAYKENLRIVLPSVKELAIMLPGRTVVTSDHGDLFGERPHLLYPFKAYGHLDGLLVKELVLVPWLILDNKNVRAHPVVTKEEAEALLRNEDEERAKTRLRALGYID